MIHIKETIIVEGKYDKAQVKKVCDAPVLCTGGFQIFKSKELINYIRQLAKTTGILVLTDSDRAGFAIRNYIKNCVRNDGAVKHAFIPSVKGKEKRKEKPGKEELLGVEGVDLSVIEKAIKDATGYSIKSEDVFEIQNMPSADNQKTLTKARLYKDGLSGKKDSFLKRKKVYMALNLPLRISVNDFIRIINFTNNFDGYEKAVMLLQNE